jgi:hypothetical protein
VVVVTIDNLELYVGSLPDWAILEGCFGSGQIRPTDIDGAVERGGCVLFLEHKGAKATVKTGQRITFEALARSGHAVIAFWTDDESGDVLRLRKWWKSADSGEVVCKDVDPASLTDLRATCSRWYAHANSLKDAA